MKTAIIIHGIDETRSDLMGMPDSPSNSHWFPWLQWKMIRRGILAQTPEMPNPYMPDMNYDEWEKTFEQFKVDENTTLIGHSNGGGFLLKYLSRHPNVRARQLVMIAPWIDVDGEHPTFHKGYELAPNLPSQLDKQKGGVSLLYSTDDMGIITKSVEKIKSVYGDKINYTEFSDKGHFCIGDIGPEFPELLEAIKW